MPGPASRTVVVFKFRQTFPADDVPGLAGGYGEVTGNLQADGAGELLLGDGEKLAIGIGGHNYMFIFWKYRQVNN